ncbi:MAG: FAD:protein FMN transferase [Clostridium argentinense]|uniref:FAD:protein FMN transferase n=1 Tax=Clostridium faecium TaxID=2762223 RepID=A0ABR8YRN1_9CLOT|nr:MULTISPECIES: FAD:protein FMN transferase [Clostridium]MBD8046539.1 FAD:protein FMN transferase [Clostridium faecium]MBS5824560.1 FAD:protein FMN transferase [Clostridium argentinense]MDU1349147.1 FAD:protein FMN transferase [Clostridium argentinense]
MKKLKLYVISLLILSITILSGCSSSNNSTKEPLSHTEVVMGTVCTIQIFDSKDTSILDKAFDRLKDLENKVSINKEGTELDKVNEMSGKEAVVVGKDTFNIIKSGLNYGKISNGNFDITIGPIVKLWGIGSENARVPSEKEISEKKSLINYNDIVIDDEKSSIFLKKPNMIIDLGGIAKGYAADEIKNLLIDNGVKSAMVNLGGNLYILGNKPNGNQWKIGIQDPNGGNNDTVGNMLVNDKSIVTSGTYQRFLEVDGKLYHHILNPETGYPYENDLLSVTILSNTSMDGDALSTSTFALGREKGLEFVNSLENIEAIFITKDKEIYLTNGLKDKFNITNNDYKLIE